MNSWKRILLCAALTTGVFPLRADNLRIELGAKDKIFFEKSEGLRMQRCTWLPSPEKTLMVIRPTTDKWERVGFRITPEKDGETALILMAAPEKDRDPWVLIDDVRLNGDPLPNGSFESLDGTTPRIWGNKWAPARGLTSREAADGAVSAKVSYRNRFSQSLKLEGGKSYEISMRVKAPRKLPDTPVPLKEFANRGFADDTAGDGKGGWTDQGPENDMSCFDFSRKEFGGIRFDVIDPAKNGGKSVPVFDSPYSNTGLKNISVAFPAPYPEGRTLYLLHTAAWGDALKDKEPGAEVRVTLADGTVVRKELKGGREIADWHKGQNLPNGKVVYSAPNRSATVALYLSAIPLSDDPVQVKGVELISKGKCVWIVPGATLSGKTVDFRSPPNKTFHAGKEWKQTEMGHVRIAENSALDLSRFFPGGEAGRFGRAVISRNGSMVFEKTPDREVRFNGFVAGWWDIQPLFERDSKDPESRKRNIAEYARQVRRHGYNLFRFHGLLDSMHKGFEPASGIFTEERLDALDYLAAELKRNGVYLYMDLAAYGMRFGGKIPGNLELKAGTMVKDPVYWEKWKACAEAILNRVNKYTGIAWKDDPAILCVDHFNEQTTGVKIATQQSWAKLPPELQNAYLADWRKWMTDRYGSPEKIASWNSPLLKGMTDFSRLAIPNFNSDGELGREFHRFLTRLFTERTKDYNKVVQDISYGGLVSQGNSNVDLGATSARWQATDVTIVNYHAGHPSSSIHKGSRVPQRSSIQNAANGSDFNYCNRINFLDRPMIMTEFSEAFWNRTRHELGVIGPAYAALNGYAGIIWHEGGVDLSTEGAWPRGMISEFRVATSPIMRAASFLCFCLFARGDVREAERRIELAIGNDYLENHSAEAVSTVQNRLGLISKFGVSFPGLPRYERLGGIVEGDLTISPDSGAEVQDGLWFSTTKDSKNTQFNPDAFVELMKRRKLLPENNISKPSQGIYQSDTGEITMFARERTLQVVTPRTEAVVTTGKSHRHLKLFSADSSVDACMAITAIDGKELKDSRRMVLLYMTREANTGMELSADETTMVETGKYPALLEVGTLNAELRNADPAGLKLYALGYDGSRGEEIPVTVKDGKLTIRLDTAKLKNGPTPFFELAEK